MSGVSHMKHVAFHKYFIPFMILSLAHVILALPGTFPPTPTFDSLPGKFQLILKAQFK